MALKRPDHNNETLETQEMMPLIRRVLGENLHAYRRHYAIAISCLIAVSGATALIPWMMRPLIDDVFYREDYGMILPIAIAVIAIFSVRGIAQYIQAVVLARIGNNLAARYQRRLFEQLLRLGLDYYADMRSARLAAQINENVIGVREMLSNTLKSIVGDSLLLVGLVIAMIALDPMLSLIALTAGPPIIWFINKVMRRLRRVARQAVEVNARLVGAMQETIQGIAVVKAFTMEEQFKDKLDHLIVDSEERANRIARVSERVSPFMEILAGIAIAGVMAYAALRAIAANEPPGSVFAFITALLLAYDPARKLARVQVNLARALVNARMIYEILDIEPRQSDLPGAAELAVSEGVVRFEDVSFGYVSHLPVLHDVSFEAKAGRTTAIVGASGSGKSTLFALLQRFYDTGRGRVVIDGQDIAAVTKYSLRANMAYVSQQPYLFEGSVADNIRYGRPGASDAEIEEAARIANVAEFVSHMPEGYETLIGENGVTLSGGQRQRISIARAVLRNAPILLLDEATSALDNQSEAKVQTALEAVMKGRTTLVIAHRLSTVINADNIVVMDQGRVIQQGRHEDLLESRSSVYARLHGHGFHLGDGMRHFGEKKSGNGRQ